MPKRPRSSGEDFSRKIVAMSPHLKEAVELVSQQVHLVPEESLTQLLKSISAERVRRVRRSGKHTERHNRILSRLEELPKLNFETQAFYQSALSPSLKGPPEHSIPDIPSNAATSSEISSQQSVQQVAQSTLVFQFPSSTHGDPSPPLTSISAIYQVLRRLESNANAGQYFNAVILFRICHLVTAAYGFKKPPLELIDHLVNVIAGDGAEEEARKVIKHDFNRYIRLGERVDSLIVRLEEGWLFGLSLVLSISELEHNLSHELIESDVVVSLDRIDGRDERRKAEQNLLARQWLSSITANCVSQLRRLPAISRVRLKAPAEVALEEVLQEQARLGSKFATEVLEHLGTLHQLSKPSSSDIAAESAAPLAKHCEWHPLGTSEAPDLAPADTGFARQPELRSVRNAPPLATRLHYLLHPHKSYSLSSPDSTPSTQYLGHGGDKSVDRIPFATPSSRAILSSPGVSDTPTQPQQLVISPMSVQPSSLGTQFLAPDSSRDYPVYPAAPEFDGSTVSGPDFLPTLFLPAKEFDQSIVAAPTHLFISQPVAPHFDPNIESGADFLSSYPPAREFGDLTETVPFQADPWGNLLTYS